MRRLPAAMRADETQCLRNSAASCAAADTDAAAARRAKRLTLPLAAAAAARPIARLQELGPHLPADVAEALAQPHVRAAFAIWTTTPWTIPANLAVAVNAELDYCLVKAEVCGGGWACFLPCYRPPLLTDRLHVKSPLRQLQPARPSAALLSVLRAARCGCCVRACRARALPAGTLTT